MSLPQPDTGLWTATPELAAIQQWAHSQKLSPIALLVSCLTLINCQDFWLNLLPGPNPERPDIGTQPASLFTLLVGHSGAGKNRTIRLAEQVLHFEDTHMPVLTRRFPKTPEGLYGLYQETRKDEDDGSWSTIQKRHQALATFPELASFLTVAKRSGNWFAEGISDFWSGHWPSQDIKNKKESLPGLADNTHLAILAGGQYQACIDLLTGANKQQGLASRWILATATDPSLPKTAPPVPDTIRVKKNWHNLKNLKYGCNLLMEPPEIAQIVDDQLWYQQTRTEPMPEGHSEHDVLNQRRLTKALSQLHGHSMAPWMEDWHLAGLVIEHSRQLKEHITGIATEVLLDINQAKTDLAVHQAHAKQAFPVRLERFIQTTWSRLLATTPEGQTFTKTDINLLASRHALACARLTGNTLPDILLARALLHSYVQIQDNQYLLTQAKEPLPSA